MVKQIDAVWALGTAAGGFPSGLTSGSPVDGTSYHLFALWNPTTKVFDAGFDSTLTPTLLLADATGFTKYKRVGSIVYGNLTTLIIDPFRATELHGGGLKVGVDAFAVFQETPAAITEQTKIVTGLPTGLKFSAHLAWLLVNSVDTMSILFGDGDETLPTPTADLFDIRVGANASLGSASRDLVTDASAQVKYRVDDTTNTTVRMVFRGWTDFRRS